jgi:hypothetical protein
VPSKLVVSEAVEPPECILPSAGLRGNEGDSSFANEIKRAPGLRKARGPAPRCHGEEDRQFVRSSLRFTIPKKIEIALVEGNEGGPSFFRRVYQRVPSSERTVRAPRTSAACRVPAGR